jgi:hypothetical protein
VEQAEVSVDELLGGLKRRGLPLPFEIGAFIALEACEQVLDRPVRVDTHDIGIGDIGEVVCTAKKTPAPEESSVRSLLALLSELLVCSAPGVPSMLLELVERGPSSGQWKLDRLRDDLEASLVPLNRGATRRVLARLVREAKKAGLERKSRPSVVPAASEIDAQFDALMELEAESGQPQLRAAAAARLAAPVPAVPARPVSSASASAFAVPAVDANVPTPRLSPTPRGSFARGDDGHATLEFELGRAAPNTAQQAASLRALRTAAAIAAQDAKPVVATGARASIRPGVDDGPLLEDVEDRLPERVGPADHRPRKGSDERSLERRHERHELDGRHADRALMEDRDERRQERQELDARRADREGTSKRPDGRLRLQSRDEHGRTESVSGRPGRHADDLLADMPDNHPSRAPMFVACGLVLAAVALAGAYLALGQSGARRVLGLAPVQEGPLPEPMAATSKPARAGGTLQVSSDPGRAQVFLFIGNGPATATDLPMGVAQEFVAMAEGYAPTRALVPEDAQWEETSGSEPRYELAMQATKLVSAEKTLELGPTLLPREVGTPTGRLGSVRVITTPKSAKVYQLIGFTPDVRVENLPVDAGYEVLVYLPGYGLQTRRVEPGDFRDQEGQRVAELSVPLTAARAHR